MQDESSKNQEPTQKKLRDARAKGQVAHSKDISSFVVITTFLMMFFMWRNWVGKTLSEGYFAVFQSITRGQIDFVNIAILSMGLIKTALLMVLSFVCIGAMMVCFSTVIQMGGFLIKKEPFKVDMQKFNPVQNLKQIFAKKNLFKFAMNCIKITIMVLEGTHLIQGMLHDIFLLPVAPVYDIIVLISYFIFKLVLVLLGINFVFAVIDFISEKMANHKKLMMSRSEIEKEFKETEGSPEIKSRRREMHKELLEEDEMWVANKDYMMIFANPTHIAIVLLYMPSKFKLPVVVIKSKGYLAQMMFRTAKIYNVPIFRDKWLARQMYAYATVKQFVPPSLVLHVADIIGKNLHLLPVIEKDIRGIKANIDAGKTSNPLRHERAL